MHYLDNAATTKVAQEVADVIYEAIKEYYGNPSSLYNIGAYSEQEIEKARAQVAKTLGCTPAELYFTACGTESNNIAIQGAVEARKNWMKHIVCTGFEHPAVYKQLERYAKQGYEVTFIAPNMQGNIDLEALVNAVNIHTGLVTFMHVNNEIGTVLPVEKLAERVKQKNARTAIHVDGVQAWGKLPVQLQNTVIDSYSITGHKVHAPKGIGALYLRKGFHIEPPFLGGGQEKGIRPGTENIPYIIGLAKASEEFDGKLEQRYQYVKSLSAYLKKQLATLGNITMNSPPDALPHVVNFSVEKVRSETLLHFLEARGVYVSSGSACSKGAASHTLVAMNLQSNRIDGAVRVSFCDENTMQDVDALIDGLKAANTELAKIR